MFRTEYPRPSFVRSDWQNLNGKWDFAILDCEQNMLEKPLTEKIEVPFCPESILSGIGYTGFMHNVWYRRSFNITENRLQGRVLLHFGACDYKTVVYINNSEVGVHIGGFSSFEFDITEFLVAGDNILDVEVFDNSSGTEIPRGKQCGELESHGCLYTRTTGIWQTVWLEFVDVSYIKDAYIKPDVDTKRISFELSVSGGTKAMAEIYYAGEPVATGEGSIENQKVVFKAELENIELWEPGNPALYDITLKVLNNETVTDTVKTYCGFRKYEIKGKKLYLNGKPHIMKHILDQGFYPDGIYTAKTVEEIYKDIDLSMSLGFNGARMHQKIFEPHYMYYADKVGYIVWGEYPSWGGRFTKENPVMVDNLINEWCEAVRRDRNHPSIIGWMPLNEAYNKNQFADRESSKRLWDATKLLDDRFVITASGGYHFFTDIYDMHEYPDNAETLQRFITEDIENWSLEKPPADRLSVEELLKLPVYFSEYGGFSINGIESNGIAAEAWGYHTANSEKVLIERYCDFTAAIIKAGAIGYCYTQLTDVEQEENGLYNYDRSFKLSAYGMEAIRKFNLEICELCKKTT